MSRISSMRLGAGLLSLAVPFMMAGPVAAQPSAPEVRPSSWRAWLLASTSTPARLPFGRASIRSSRAA